MNMMNHVLNENQMKLKNKDWQFHVFFQSCQQAFIHTHKQFILFQINTLKYLNSKCYICYCQMLLANADQLKKEVAVSCLLSAVWLDLPP